MNINRELLLSHELARGTANTTTVIPPEYEDNDAGECADIGQEVAEDPSSLKNEEETRTKSAEEINKDHEYIRTSLRNFPWYHGFLIREELPHILKVPNSFLVRRSPGNFTDVFCISILRDHISHFVILWNEKPCGWHSPKLFEKERLKPQTFAHIHLLIDHWMLKKMSIAVPRTKINNLFEEDVVCEKLIFSGNNGDIYNGAIKLNGTVKNCAIRKIKLNAGRRVKRNFFAEIRLLSQLDNENVIKFYGQSTILPPMMSFFELAMSGTLHEYMRDSKSNVSNEILFGFVYDIAKGMNYISDQTIIHRDLSATNCLIGAHLTCKVGNFKSAVQAVQITETSLRTSRIRWASPETLSSGVYNQKTDVWSFGVVIWQIYTNCHQPPLALAKNSREVRNAIRANDYPHRLPRGKKNYDVQQIQMSCNEKKAENRLVFAEIVKRCRNVMRRVKNSNIPRQNLGETSVSQMTKK